MSVRQQEIIDLYLSELEKHMTDLRNGRAESTLEIKDLAELLHIHPRHLSNTIHEVIGRSPCDIYEGKLMGLARELLLDRNAAIADVARQLSFDPSNFTKFFKRYEGVTPKAFREAALAKI